MVANLGILIFYNWYKSFVIELLEDFKSLTNLLLVLIVLNIRHSKYMIPVLIKCLVVEILYFMDTLIILNCMKVKKILLHVKYVKYIVLVEIL